MATARPFAYHTGPAIDGTLQLGNLSIGTPTSGFTDSPQYWNGPDEDLGYVIAIPVSGNTQPTPLTLTWDPNYAGTGIVLTSGNTVATVGQIQSSVLGTRLISSPSKVMYSIRVNQLVNGQIGFGLQDMDLNSYVGGFDAKSIGFSSNGDYLHAGAVQDTGLPTWGNLNDVVDIALDLNVGIWWIRVNGGNWNGVRNEDPSSGTGSVNSAGLNNLYPAITPFPVNIQGQVTLLSQPVYSVPSGFTFLGEANASVGFYRTSGFSDSEFIGLGEYVSNQSGNPQTFSTANEASTWLTNNGFWNSYVTPTNTPTQTPTNTLTATPTRTTTPTPTQTGYLYYRWQITQAKETPPNSDCVQAAEFVFQIGGVDQSMAGVTVTNPNGNNPIGETPPNLVDNNLTTKALDLNFVSNGNITNFIFQFSSAKSFDGYRWATANDEESRDPKSWTIAGSNNGITWTTLSTVSNFTTTVARDTWQTAQTY